MSAREEGKLYFQKGKFSAAADAYTEAITLEPSNAALYQNRALCYQKLSRWQNVLNDARKATELERGSVKGHYLVGTACSELDLLDDAEAAFMTALSLSSSPQLQSYRGSVEQGLYGVRAQKHAKEECAELACEDADRAILEELVHEAAQRSIERGQVEEGEATQREMLQELKEWTERAAANRERPPVPECLCCQITFEIMREPMLTPSGQTFEREAIEQHLKQNGKWDPVTRQPLQVSDLRENKAVKLLIADFLKKHPWAFNAS
mmetsp:Transcript_53112/g.125472  ORF Transcript_53112/g.125472 Transcript_53112/m.125472 type:complete len:265 (-) Transcript_53112:546-1340(-)